MLNKYLWTHKFFPIIIYISIYTIFQDEIISKVNIFKIVFLIYVINGGFLG